jgi:hypothetical protein
MQRPSEKFRIPLDCNQEILVDIMGWRRPFGLKGQLKMADYSSDGFRFFDIRDNDHPAAAFGAK